MFYNNARFITALVLWRTQYGRQRQWAHTHLIVSGAYSGREPSALAVVTFADVDFRKSRDCQRGNWPRFGGVCHRDCRCELGARRINIGSG